MDSLVEKLLAVMATYAGKALNGNLYLTHNDERTLFMITSIADVRGENVVETGIVVRVEYDVILIMRDISNKPLVDALVQAGIPREKIILAYADEQVPESA